MPSHSPPPAATSPAPTRPARLCRPGPRAARRSTAAAPRRSAAAGPVHASGRLRWPPLGALAVAAACCRGASAAALAANERAEALTRIINGTVVRNASAEYSFFALPTSGPDSDTWLGCGASIISPTFGLTSAHCFGGGLSPCQGPTSLALWLGDVEIRADRSIAPVAGARSARVVADVMCSSDFDGKCSHGHDIALLKLRLGQEGLPAWVKPVPVDKGAGRASLSLVGSSVKTIGFGLVESKDDPGRIADVSPFLREVSVDVLPQDSPQCARVYSGGWGCSDEYSEGQATNLHQQLCAGAADPERPRDTCSGDSGSPMLDATGAQVGIVSYGGGPGEKLSGPGRVCGDPSFPGVYARISAFAGFLQAHVPDLPGDAWSPPAEDWLFAQRMMLRGAPPPGSLPAESPPEGAPPRPLSADPVG